ncbi:MAG: hypothetical protein ABJM11_02095 [Marinobacter sp.]|uniref:hypothetical protein n=1 Tax=Marinobacter sp. TaxID=50741 RepID=UPI003299FB92
MCGEFEEEDYIDDQLFGRLLQMASKYGVSPVQADEATPSDLSTQEARSSYMSGLFQAGLTRAVNDANNLAMGERMDAVAGQAIAFARLAGFLAGQLPPGADVLRPVIDALMEGHREPAEWGVSAHDHHHQHDHAHQH